MKVSGQFQQQFKDTYNHAIKAGNIEEVENRDE
jgi:hypothetical protein